MISILNALFDVQAKAIQGHGGEILKFIGRSACDIPDPGWRHSGLVTNARAAAQEAVAAVRCLSGEPFMAVEPPLEIVVALHVGTVVYGNIGAAERLDFTVIGPAVNLVSWLETTEPSLCRNRCGARW